MHDELVFRAHRRRGPQGLLQLFALLSLGAIVLIMVFTGLGITRVSERSVIGDAERTAVGIGRAIFTQESGHLLGQGPGGKPMLVVSPEGLATLDRRMTGYLAPFNMLRIKFFAPDKEIVYSTDHGIIGQKDADNTTLGAALTGQTVSRLTRKGSILDLAGEQRYQVDVVETCLPVITPAGQIAGAVEVSVDVTPALRQLKATATSSLVVLLVVLTVAFGVLCALMAVATRELADARRHLEEMAVTDGLTTVANRRFLMARLDEEHERVRRGFADALGLVMVDIDHFKWVNDAFGHQTGDEVLKAVGQRLRQTVRRYDLVGRYGGEEFLLLLPNTGAAEVQAVAERVWAAIRGTPVARDAGEPVAVTASLGLAVATREDREPAMALARADAALYRAKHSGRDRICGLATAGRQRSGGREEAV
ncbi:MAG: GGDEF domain-containing protein [Thermodesulfobacteriota bacterium]